MTLRKAMMMAAGGTLAALGGLACAQSAGSTGQVELLSSYPANQFLNSMGVNIHIDQGYTEAGYVAPLAYLGLRQVRDGYRNAAAMVALAKATGVHFTLIDEGDLAAFMTAARQLRQANALLAVEGPDEPNNFPVTYNGKLGGGTGSWLPIAQLQRDLYAQVKADPLLAATPVFGVSEVGAENDNVGLQYNRIPAGAGTAMPDGTTYADYANVHNYVSAVSGGYGDNQAWSAADPQLRGRWDGLAVNYGVTWRKGFSGYAAAALPMLPRVTTETGWASPMAASSEALQGKVLVNTYLAQFKRGWAYSFIYELRDNEGGTSQQGLYNGTTPKLAAAYIHNLTTILADTPGAAAPAATLQVAEGAATAHALLLTKSNGQHFLVLWGENASGQTSVTVNFGVPVATRVYDVTQGTGPVEALAPSSRVVLVVSDHPLIVSY